MRHHPKNMKPSPSHIRRSCLKMILLCLAATGCRTFNYTEADMEKERRQISGDGSKPCRSACWHEAHGYDRGFAGDFGKFHPAVGRTSLPADLGKCP